MTLPSPLPLDPFERAIQADPEVLGAFYFGSLGRGVASRFSDLDIFICLPDDFALPTRDKMLQLLGLFGQLHWEEINHCGFVGPEWTQVDIEFASRSQLE